MTQISELVGSGKILIDKMPRGSVEYWITVHRADDDTTSGQGSIHDQYSHPARIVAFSTAEGWSRDVTIDIADELRRLGVRRSASLGAGVSGDR